MNPITTVGVRHLLHYDHLNEFNYETGLYRDSGDSPSIRITASQVAIASMLFMG